MIYLSSFVSRVGVDRVAKTCELNEMLRFCLESARVSVLVRFGINVDRIAHSRSLCKHTTTHEYRQTERRDIDRYSRSVESMGVAISKSSFQN